jgi:hypothetical protein
MKAKRRKLTKRVIKAPPRKKLSGAEFKKRRRERLAAAAAAAGIAPTSVVLPVIGELNSVSDWHRELGDLYRRARIGDIRQEDASRLAWIAKESARIAGTLQELKELESLRAQLSQLSNGSLPQVTRGYADEVIES